MGDCLEVMKEINDKSVDMILCDLPYGTTQCKWDSIIPFNLLWDQYIRIIKENGAIILTSSQPFTSALIMSNIGWFKYCWVWDKVKPSGHLNAKKMPMKVHEDICVFGKRVKYNPIMIPQKERKSKNYTKNKSDLFGNEKNVERKTSEKYPNTILSMSNANQKGKIHPTQKPLDLFEYLIKTYTNEGEIVLDNCIGSGTTAIAAINTNRNYIGIEKDENYYEIAKNRVLQHSNTNGSTGK